MKINPRKFFKQNSGEDRDRIDFNSILQHCPDLGNRVIVVRSRVKDLRQKFQSDCDWALKNYSFVTIVTMGVAISGALIGLLVSIFQPHAALAALVSIAIGAVVGIVGAASKAFGWHKRYSAMFSARWAMASLEIQIDDLIIDLALDVEEGTLLSEANRDVVKAAKDRWLRQIDSTLKIFRRCLWSGDRVD